MKKIFGILLVMAVAVFAFACGGPATNVNNSNAPKNTNTLPVMTPPAVVNSNSNSNTNVGPTMPPPPANGSKPDTNSRTLSTQGKTVDEKMKEKENMIKSANTTTAPAAAPTKKP